MTVLMFVLLVFALVFSIMVALKFEPPQVNIRWVVVALLIGAYMAMQGAPLFK